MKRLSLLTVPSAALLIGTALAVGTPASALESDQTCAIGTVLCETILIPVCVEWQLEPFTCLRYELEPMLIYGDEEGPPDPT